MKNQKKSRIMGLSKVLIFTFLIAGVLTAISYLKRNDCMLRETSIKNMNDRLKFCNQQPVIDFSSEKDESNNIHNPFHPFNNRK